MNESTVWWLVTGALVAAELLSGTFLLLMLAIASSAAAIAAHLGASLNTQLVVAAVVGAVAALIWRKIRLKQDALAPDEQHFDIGETILVDQWDPQGTAQAKHRGAQWTAVCLTPPIAGMHRIHSIQGNRLVLEKI